MKNTREVLSRWYIGLSDEECRILCKKYFPLTEYSYIKWEQVNLMYCAERNDFAGIQFYDISNTERIYTIKENKNNETRIIWTKDDSPIEVSSFLSLIASEDWVIQDSNNYDEIIPNPMREKAVSDYIRQKHNSDECIGFADGYECCQKDVQPLMDEKDNTISDILETGEELESNFKLLSDSHKALLDALKAAHQYMNVFMIRGEEPLLGENLKTDLFNVLSSIEKAEKLINK